MKDTFHLDSTSVQPWVSCLLKLQGSDNISSQGGQREWLFFPFLFFHLMSMLCWSLVNCSFVLVLSIQWTDSVMTYTYSFYYFLLILLPTEVIEQGWVKFSVLNISSLWSNYSVQLLSHVKLLWPHGLQHPGFPVHHQLPELAHIHVHWVSDVIQPCNPLSSLLLLPSIFPSIRVFSNESALCIRWPKYWSFSFSISPSNEYSGLISFRIYWFDLLAVQGTLRSLFQHHSLKASVLRLSAFFIVQRSHDNWKNHSFD